MDYGFRSRWKYRAHIFLRVPEEIRRSLRKSWRGPCHEPQQGILIIRSRSMRGMVEEAPGAYKDVDLVAEVTEQAWLARRVAFLRPKVCVKG
ncbi:MAG: RtcB family protein [Nitrosospira sp.]